MPNPEQISYNKTIAILDAILLAHLIEVEFSFKMK